MFRRFLWVVPAIMIAGCETGQLNYNTLDIASKTDTLLTKQVLHNLSNFIDSDIAIPAQVVISAGSTATTNTISPSVNFPLTNAVTVVGSAAHSLVAAGNTFGTTNTLSTAAAGATLSGTDAWSQNLGWSLITDEFILRLRALYRIAVSQEETKASDFIKSYPLIPKSISRSRPVCVRNEITQKCAVLQVALANVVGKTSFDKNGVLLPPPTPPYAPAPSPPKHTVVINMKATSLGTQTADGGGPGTSSTAGTDTFSDQVPDEYYLKGPGCAVCLKNGQHYVEKFPHNLQVNANLKGNWLHWRALPGATKVDNYGEGDIPLGQYGNYELFVDRNQPEKYAEFVLFVLAASTQSQTSTGGGGAGGGAGGGGGGGGGGGVKTPAAPFVLAPAGPVLTLPIQ